MPAHDDVSPADEFTIDELAARAQMTVRNVRAYASRGLIEAPRLAGRTGYYSTQHLQRLQLVRQLIDRGYTLSAVEKAVRELPAGTAGSTLDLIAMLDLPADDDTDEIMSRQDLAALANVPLDSTLIDALEANGLVAWIEGDDDHVRLLEPTIVRAGATVVSMGIEPKTVIDLFPILDARLKDVAEAFVNAVGDEIVDPFVAQGLPPEEFAAILGKIEQLLPIASQVTLAVFRRQLQHAIDEELEADISNVGKPRKRRKK